MAGGLHEVGQGSHACRRAACGGGCSEGRKPRAQRAVQQASSSGLLQRGQQGGAAPGSAAAQHAGQGDHSLQGHCKFSGQGEQGADRRQR